MFHKNTLRDRNYIKQDCVSINERKLPSIGIGEWTVYINWIASYSICVLMLLYHFLNADIYDIQKDYGIVELREKGRDLTQSYDKSPYTDRELQKATWQHINATKNLDYTTIADWLRTVSWSNASHPTGVVKPVYGIPTFPLTTKSVLREADSKHWAFLGNSKFSILSKTCVNIV